MADQSDDPDIALGKRIASGQVGTSYTAPSGPDPDLEAGRKIAAATPQQPADGGTQPPGGTPPSGVATPNEGWLGFGTRMAGDVVDALTRGLSWGGSNWLDRGTAALFPGSAFAKLQAQREQEAKNFQTEHPIIAQTAQIAGSVPTYALGEGALRAVVPEVTGGGVLGTAANLGGAAARNAAVSGAEAAATTEGSLADRAKAAETGAATGAVLGPVGDVAGRAVGRFLGGASSVSSGDAALGDLAIKKYGIPVTAQDLTNNSLYRIAGDQAGKLPFSGAVAADAEKLAKWRGAIGTEMGEPGVSNFTPDVLTDAKTRISKGFNDVANRTSIDQPNATQMVGDLGQAMHDAQSIPLSEGELKALQKQVDDIVDRTAKGNGTLSGQAYQALTRTGAPLDVAESSSNPNVRHVAGQIRDALDDAFVRSASPQDAADLVKLKYQYRIMRTVDQLAAGSRDGTFTPDAFMQKVLTASRRFDSPTGGIAYTGGGNIGELARIGKLFRAAPNSGTPDRMIINAAAGLGGLGAGGAAAAGAVNPLTALAVPGGLAANRIAQSALRSQALAQTIINRRLGPNMLRAPAPLVPGVWAGRNALAPYNPPDSGP